MAMPFVYAVGAVAQNITAVTPGIPAGTDAGDVLILYVETEEQAVPAITDWFEVAGSPVSVATGTVTRLTVRWHRATGPESGTITVPDSGDHQVARIIGVRGCITSGDPWDGGGASGTELVSDTTVSIPGGTTTTPNCLILAAVATGTDVASTTHASVFANPSLSGVTERIDDWAAVGLGGGMAVASGGLAAAGPYSATTATLITANFKALHSIALKPPIEVGSTSVLLHPGRGPFFADARFYRSPRSAEVPAAGGATFPEAMAGTVAAVGELLRQAQKTLAGSSTPAGPRPVLQPQKPLDASVTPTGPRPVLQTRKPLAGTTPLTGVLATTKVILRAVAGTVTTVGALTRQTQKALTGSSIPTGALVRQARKVLTGNVTATGVLAALKTVLRAFAGIVTATGALFRQGQKPLAGTATPTGTLARQTRKPLAGDVAATGALAALKTVLRAFAGTIATVGALLRQTRKPLTGQTTPTGTVARQPGKPFTGTVTATGTTGFLKVFTRAFAGTATATGALVRRVGKALAGQATPAGQLTRTPRKTLAGSSAPTGAFARGVLYARAFAGTVTPATSSLRWRVGKALTGQAAPTGTLTRRTTHAFTGAVAAAGGLLAEMVLVAAVRLQAAAVGAVASLGGRGVPPSGPTGTGGSSDHQQGTPVP